MSNFGVLHIAGATGNLGKRIARVFQLPEYRSRFSKIVLLTRDDKNAPEEFLQWAKEGTAELRKYKMDDLQEVLADATVMINVIGSTGHQLRQKIVKSLNPAALKLYIPSEFGVDHTVHDFQHIEWDKKKAHYNEAKQNLPNTKICRIFAGLFLEDSIGPWFGFNTKDGKYEAVGSSETQISFTSLDDIARTIAQVAIMPRDRIPNELHIAGDTASCAQIGQIMGRKSGSDTQVTELDLNKYKENELHNPREDPSGCLRFLMGEGNINHTSQGLGCDNELVNPGQKNWRWKTLTDLAEETNGKPWADIKWPPDS